MAASIFRVAESLHKWHISSWIIHLNQIQSPWRWRQHIPPKHLNKLIILHTVTTQMTITVFGIYTKPSITVCRNDYLHGLQLCNSLNTETCLGQSITSEKVDWSSEPMIVIHHTWVGVLQVYTQFWWTVCKFLISLAGPYAQPIFHPVTLNVFPADPIVIVLSHIPGKVAVIRCNQLIHDL